MRNRILVGAAIVVALAGCGPAAPAHKQPGGPAPVDRGEEPAVNDYEMPGRDFSCGDQGYGHCESESR